jgi:hypothetical protein
MIDFKKDSAYKAEKNPKCVCAEPALFIKVDGTGPPASDSFQEAVSIVYGLVYAVKFWGKKHNLPEGYDKFTGAPLEGIWWLQDGKKFDAKKPGDWQWTVMMRVPEFVTDIFFKKVVNETVKNKKTDIYTKARLEMTHEGLCVQIMHVGPYDKEKSSLDKLNKYVEEKGYEVYGRHHEIYLSDPRRVPKERLKTILRYPIRKKDAEVVLPRA